MAKMFSKSLSGFCLQQKRYRVALPESIPDLHAMIHCALGINPCDELFAGTRPVPITDGGKPVRELFGT